jgi:hypothetical protein
MSIQQRSHTVLDSPATAWVDLPEYVFEAVVEHIQEDRKVSAIFRLVCCAWREAHDRLVTGLKANGAPRDTRVWRKLRGVRTLHFRKTSLLVNDDCLRMLTPLVSLNSLSLGGGFRGGRRIVPSVTDEGMRALSSLTTLTYLDMIFCDLVTNDGFRALASLTALCLSRLVCDVYFYCGNKLFLKL